MSIRLLSVAAFAALVVVSVSACGAVDGGPYGIHAHVSRNEWPDFIRTYDATSEVGVRWMRMDFDWNRCEPAPGKWDFSRYDRIVEEAARRNLYILPVLGDVPIRERPCEQHLDAWANYVTRIVSRYAGRIPVWEVWNEPNGSVNPTNYMAILRAAYHAIKRADPSARVAISGFSCVPLDYIECLLKLGANDCYDIMNVHPYCQPFAPEGIVDVKLHQLRVLMARYGGGGKPVWFTEIGWPTQRPSMRCGDALRIGLQKIDSKRDQWRIACLKRYPDAPRAEGRQMAATVREVMKGSAVVMECECAGLADFLVSKQVDVLVFPWDESYPADALESAVTFVRNGGVVFMLGGFPLSYAWRLHDDGVWRRDKNPDAQGCALDKFRIAKKAWWMDSRYPKETVMHPTAAAGDFAFPSYLQKPVVCGRYFSTELLKAGDRFIPLLTGGVTNGVDTVGAAVYHFGSDWKGAVIVSGSSEKLASGTDEALQADYLARIYALCCAEDVENCFWYEYRAPERLADDPESHFGSVHADFREKPAFAALRTFIAQRPAGSFALPQTKDGGLYHLPWICPNGVRAGMLWTTGSATSYVLKGMGACTFVDVLGKPLTFPRHEGGYRVSVSGSPVYYREVDVVTPKRVANENVWWAGTNYWTRRHAATLRDIARGPKKYDCVFLGDSITHNWTGWDDPIDIAVVTRAHDGGKGPLKFPNGPGRAVWREMSQRYRLLNLAVGGDGTAELLWRLQHGALDGYRTRLFTLMIGTNDVTDDPAKIAAGVRACLAALRTKHPEAKVLLHAIFPRDAKPGTRLRKRNDAVNALIRPLADGKSVFWIDLAPRYLTPDGELPASVMPDYLHPLEYGYRVWRQMLEPYFETFGSVHFAKAQPVWPAGCGKTMNETFVFTAHVCGSSPRPAVLRIAAVSAYKAWMNGALVCAGPARAPAGYARVDEYPVSLAHGDNRLVIEVNSYRCNNFYFPDQAPFLCAECVVGEDVLAATAEAGSFTATTSDRVVKTPRLSYQRGFSEARKVGGEGTAQALPLAAAGRGVVFLPRVAPSCVFPVSADLAPIGSVRLAYDTTLPPARDRCLVAVNPPKFRGYPPSECDVDVWNELLRWRKAPPAASDGVMGTLYRGSANKTGFLRIEIDCAEPGRFIAAMDELETAGDVNPLRIEIAAGAVWDIQRPGRYVLETAEPHSFQYVRLAQVSGKATWKDPVRILWHNPELFNRPCRTQDKALAAIYAAGAETLAQNATDVLMDCPSREHAGWLGDSYFSAPAVQKLSGNAAVERAFLQNFALGKCPNIPPGMIPMCWPSDHTAGGFIPTYALWFVLEVEDYMRRTGDGTMGEIQRENILGLMAYFKRYRNADGLLEKLPGWVFIGWDRSNDLVQDVSYPANLLYAATLEAVTRLTGDAHYAAEARQIRAAVRKQSLKNGLFHDHAVRKPDGRLVLCEDATETCQYYAFFFNAATPQGDAALWQRLVHLREQSGVSVFPSRDAAGLFPSVSMRLRLLTANGERARAERELKDDFLRMAERTGTLWEHLTTRASCNHAFAAAVLTAFDK